MLKQRLIIVAALLVIVLNLGIVFVAFLPRLAGRSTAPKVYNTATVLQQVQTLSQLVTVKYVMERVMIVEVPPEGVVAQLFAGENRILLLAHGIVKAGIDLARLAPGDLQISEKKIVVKLPPAQITDAYLDDKQTRVIERTTGLFRSFDKDLEQTTRQNAIDDINRAARASGILKDAEERARAQLTTLFIQLGFEQVQFR